MPFNKSFSVIILCFWMSCLAIAGVIATVGMTLYPFLMPSLTHPNQSLTVWNATSSQYALNVMLYVGGILLFIILAYRLLAFHIIWGKKKTLTLEDMEKDPHSYY